MNNINVSDRRLYIYMQVVEESERDTVNKRGNKMKFAVIQILNDFVESELTLNNLQKLG